MLEILTNLLRVVDSSTSLDRNRLTDKIVRSVIESAKEKDVVRVMQVLNEQQFQKIANEAQKHASLFESVIELLNSKIEANPLKPGEYIDRVGHYLFFTGSNARSLVDVMRFSCLIQYPDPTKPDTEKVKYVIHQRGTTSSFDIKGEEKWLYLSRFNYFSKKHRPTYRLCRGLIQLNLDSLPESVPEQVLTQWVNPTTRRVRVRETLENLAKEILTWKPAKIVAIE